MPDLGRPASRKECHHESVPRDTQDFPGAVPGVHGAGVGFDLVGQRMADEDRSAAMVLVQGRFERIQRQHRVRCPGNTLDPPRSPSVYGRADVVRGRDAALLHGPFEHEVEHVEVDADDDVHGFGEEPALEPAQQPEQARAAQERVPEAIDGQRLQGGKGLQTLGEHRLAADADELDIGDSLANRRHEPAAQDVAGRLACDDPDFHHILALPVRAIGRYCRRRSRTMPCSDASIEPTKHATSGTAAAVGLSSRKASFSVRPRR